MQANFVSLRWFPDIHYAEFLLERARNFWPDSEQRRDMDRDIFYHHCAISIELGLKAYLAQAGVTPAYMTRRIGHDLEEAMACAQGFGLRPPTPLNEVQRLLHPHFMNGGFQRERRRWPADMELPTHMVVSGPLSEALYAIEMRKPTSFSASLSYALCLFVDDARIELAPISTGRI